MEPSCTSNLMNPIFFSRFCNTVRSTIRISVLLKFEENLKDEHNMQIVNRPLSSFITRSISSCSSENSGIAFDFLFESDSRTFRYKPSVPKRRKQYISAANKWTRLRHYISQTAAHTAFSWTENGGLATLSEQQQWNAHSKHRTIIITRQTSAARQPTSSLPLFREFRDGRLTKNKAESLVRTSGQLL